MTVRPDLSTDAVPAQAEAPAVEQRPPSDPVTELRAEVAELRRQLESNDEEIDILQVESAKQHRKWFKDPTSLTAVLAVAISVLSTLLGQYNLSSDRELQDRARLTTLIQQLPETQQKVGKGELSAEGLVLLARDAAGLMDEVESSSFEKLEVATALQTANEFTTARTLTEQALAQEQASDTASLSTTIFATRVLARLNYQIADPGRGRDGYARSLEILGRPVAPGESPLLRRYESAYTELLWAQDELNLALDCAGARLHFGNSTSTYETLVVAPPLQANIDALGAALAKRCP